ncbi:MAG: sugar phosphate isomerase/epimerase [Clostridiales bacterium]|nr:sugar phosphate isomerase/epimerase [Clostridiales bacterium]
MKLATTIAGTWRNYYKTDQERIRRVAKTNFRYIDYDFWHLNEQSPLMQKDWQREIESIKSVLSETGIRAIQAHSPGGNPLIEAEAEPLFNRTVRAIECCALLDIPQIVIHPGAYDGISKQDFFDKNKAFYEKFFPIIEKTGVNVLIENIGTWQDPYYIHDGHKLRELIEYVNHPLVHACWDTGHGNIADADQYDSILALGHHLKGLHIHDNMGGFDVKHKPSRQDMHGMPFTGGVNFDAVIQGLLDINYQGYFTYEVYEIRAINRKNFIYKGEKVNKLLLAPADIDHKVRVLLYDMGKYMLEQYNCFEE